MAAFTTWAERFDLWARLTVPYGFVVLLMVFNVITLPEIMQSTVKLPLVLMAIYYWSIYRPTLLPVWLAFILGITLDFLMGLPLGLNALSLVISQWLIADQRRFLMGQSFWVLWLGFVLISCASFILQWVGFGLVKGLWGTIMPQIWSWGIGVLIFPLVYWLLHLTHKILPFPAASSPYALKRQSRVKQAKG